MKSIVSAIVLITLSVFAEAHTDLECKVSDTGWVYLTTHYEFAPGKTQMMVLEVGQETWRNPNHARPACEEIKQSLVSFDGPRWTKEQWQCDGTVMKTKYLAFSNAEGKEFKFFAQNSVEYRFFVDHDPSFRMFVRKLGQSDGWANWARENCGP